MLWVLCFAAGAVQPALRAVRPPVPASNPAIARAPSPVVDRQHEQPSPPAVSEGTGALAAWPWAAGVAAAVVTVAPEGTEKKEGSLLPSVMRGGTRRDMSDAPKEYEEQCRIAARTYLESTGVNSGGTPGEQRA